MVYFFTSNVVSPSAFIYVGKDKEENEDLIKYGLEEDVWFHKILIIGRFSRFHADKLSSAHVYLRMTENQTWDTIPQPLLEDCAQLTKANSIEGNKKDNVTIIYTPWSNLHKDGSMATGQVSFKDPKLTKRLLIPTRTNAIVNRLNKTRLEQYPDLRAEKEEHLARIRRREQKERDERKAEEKKVARERQDLKWQKDHAYDELFSEENVMGSSNQDRGSDWEEDFM